MASKTITVTHNGKNYTLEFNRAIVTLMERQGFNLSEFESKSALNTSLLIKFAFFLHHRKLSEDEIFEIYSSIRKRDEFISKLLDMCSDTYVSLLDDPEEDSGEIEGNATWGASW